MVNIGDLASIAIVFVVATITIAIGLDLVGDIEEDFACENSGFPYWNATSRKCCLAEASCGQGNASQVEEPSVQGNATGEGITGLGNLSERLPILATAVVLGIIIGVLLRVFRVM